MVVKCEKQNINMTQARPIQWNTWLTAHVGYIQSYSYTFKMLIDQFVTTKNIQIQTNVPKNVCLSRLPHYTSRQVLSIYHGIVLL